jgi:hypothetical protein
MLRIVGFKNCISNEGKAFISLTLQGGIEIINSSNGNFYATARKASVACTFDEETCKSLIGTELSGKIEKVECPGYEYTVEKTGEVIVLHHRFIFVPEQQEEVPIEELQEQEYHELENYKASLAM